MKGHAMLQVTGRPAVNAPDLRYRVGFLGCPSRPQIDWNEENLGRLQEYGFNTIQLNIAWGSRPGREALNLEDVVELPHDREAELAGNTPLLGEQSPEARAWRRDALRARIGLCRRLGLRTLFHFGAPYVGDRFACDAPANCLLDGRTTERCQVLLQAFAREFPGVDDILVYTYDQHAWLCSEFGPCPRCTGKPLAERVVPFLEGLAATWREAANPEGRLWWEPWELSAGQVLQCVEKVHPAGFGLALHANIAEVMGSLPADRWFKNTVALAAQRGIPALGEYWLGGPSEEVEPYTHLAYPLVTLRGLQALAAVPELAGIKEYYGLLPDQEDPNLRLTGLFFSNPAIDAETALAKLAEPYAGAAAAVIQFWRLTSEAMDLFPWDASWLMRAIGRSDPAHSLSAAIVRGVPWHTPSWCSTRRSLFMVVDTAAPPDPWMLEDIQLRCELAAERMQRALALEAAIVAGEPRALRAGTRQGLAELREFRRRVLAYAYHGRETNLATAIRERRKRGLEVPESVWQELKATLIQDQANQGQEEPVGAALALLESDPERFLAVYFIEAEDRISKGYNSVTSR
jgi:hypothetical protein